LLTHLLTSSRLFSIHLLFESTHSHTQVKRDIQYTWVTDCGRFATGLQAKTVTYCLTG